MDRPSFFQFHFSIRLKNDELKENESYNLHIIRCTGSASAAGSSKARPQRQRGSGQSTCDDSYFRDTMMRKGIPYFGRLFLGLMKPKNPIVGTGFAGVIEAIGKDVQQFQKGDKVFGESVLSSGTNAEYVCVPHDGVLTLRPKMISDADAAPICDGALTALSFLKDLAHIQSGQRILINGASGSMGTAAVQLARYYGAEVTGVCGPKHIELVKKLGAHQVIDYTTSDFTKTGKTYDIIFDTVGKRSFFQCKGSLTKKGLYISPVLGSSLLFHMLWTLMAGGKKAKFSATGLRSARDLHKLLQELKALFVTGKLKSVIGRSYPLEQIVEAHRYVDQGHKKGNIVIIIQDDMQVWGQEERLISESVF